MTLKYFSSLFFSTAALIAAFALWNAPSAEAACCRCKIPETSGEVCITKEAIDCDKLYTAGNPDLKSAESELDNNQASCKKVASGGVCKNDPIDVLAFRLPSTAAPAKSGADFDPAIPNLNISIPGLSFTPAYISNNKVVVPYLAQYIIAFQKLLMGLGLVAAALMIVYGGFLYIVSATGAKVTAGKKYIIDALVGVAIIAGSYVILINLNPSTVRMDALQLNYVEPIYDTTPTAPMDNVSPGQGQKSNEQAIIEGAKMAKADPCNVLALCQHETGLRQIWNGWTGTNSGNPKENSFSWGACSADAKFLRDGSVYDQKMRTAFPNEWPPLGKDLPIAKGESAHYENMPEKAELMINNPRMDGYLIGLQMGAATINSVANIGIGSANIKRWRDANDCSGARDITLATAASMGIEAAINAACLPVAAAGGKGCPQDKQNCSPVDDSKLSSITKGYKIETSGTIHGKCLSTGEQCFTIFTQDHVRYSIKTYQTFDAKYHCSGTK